MASSETALTRSAATSQAIVIALDVEDDPAILEDAGAAVVRLDIRRLAPDSLLHLIGPGFQGLLGIRVSIPEIPQIADGNDSHAQA